MTEDFGKDMLMLGGTLTGFVAAMLTVMEKLLDIRGRLIAKKEQKSPSPTERTVAGASSHDRFLFDQTLPRYLLSPLVRNRRDRRSRPAPQLCRAHVEPPPGKHPVPRHDGNGAGRFPLGPLVGSHRRPSLEFRRELAVVPRNRSGCDDFPLVAGEHNRRVLLGLDGQTSRLSKVSPYGTQFRPVPCLVSLYLRGRRRDRHEPAGNLCPGGAA